MLLVNVTASLYANFCIHDDISVIYTSQVVPKSGDPMTQSMYEPAPSFDDDGIEISPGDAPLLDWNG